MKLLYAIVLIFSLLAVGINGNQNANNNTNISQDGDFKLPWFVTHFNPVEFRLFIGETVLSIENRINPNMSTACVQQFINNTNTDYASNVGFPNISNFIRGLTELTKKCGIQQIFDKVVIDLNFIAANGLKTFISKEINGLAKNADAIVDCWKNVLIVSYDRRKQAMQLGQCLSFFITEPDF